MFRASSTSDAFHTYTRQSDITAVIDAAVAVDFVRVWDIKAETDFATVSIRFTSPSPGTTSKTSLRGCVGEAAAVVVVVVVVAVVGGGPGVNAPSSSALSLSPLRNCRTSD